MFRKIILNVAVFLLLLVPVVGIAASGTFNPDGGKLGQYVKNISSFINTVVIPFLLGIGFLFFVWGMFQYFIKGGDDDDAKKKGKSLIIYATSGFVLIFIFWGLVSILTDFTGLKDQTLDSGLIPSVPSGGRGLGVPPT